MATSSGADHADDVVPQRSALVRPLVAMPDKFSVHDDWEIYVRRFEDFLRLAGTPADLKASYLRNFLDKEAYTLLADRVAPTTVESLSFEQVKDQMSGLLKPQKSIIASSFAFDHCCQRSGETLADFSANLRRLAVDCKFNEVEDPLDRRLRDRFVCGLRSEAMQRRLLAEPNDNISFADALILAQTMEAAEAQARQMQSGAMTDSTSVNLLRKGCKGGEQQKQKNSSSGDVNSSFQCYSCGNTGHKRSECKFRDATCHNCKRQGHIARACMAEKKLQARQFGNRRRRPGQTNAVIGRQSPDLIGTVSTVQNPKSPAPYYLTVPINSRRVKMSVDTGSCCTLVSSSVWKQIGKPRLSKGPSLTAANGLPLNTDGVCSVSVSYKGRQRKLDLHVTKCPSNLLGRDWIAALGIQLGAITQVNAVGELPKKRLSSLLASFDEVFNDELGTCRNFQAKLHLKPEAVPKFFKPRAIPLALKDSVGQELDRLVQKGILEKIDFSEWAAPIVPVLKPSKQVRVCGDFKVTVNPQLHVDTHPLPLPEEIYAKLAGGQCFSTIDFADAYLQIQLEPSAQELLVINTHQGLYRYKRLPFGVSSAPAIFQRVMDQLTQGLPGVASYLDDVIITGKNDQEHLENLGRFLARVKQSGFRIRREKCLFMAASVKYLGHTIDNEGIHPSSAKVKAIKEMPAPKNLHQLRSFLGAINFYSKFIPSMADLTVPLTRLEKKNVKWCWSEVEDRAFRKLKDALTSDKVLTHYSPQLPLGLSCDASSVGIGAVLFHILPDGTERPIQYASKTLTDAERNYSQLEREALSIIFGIKKFHTYLYGQKFKLVTDHKPLLSILSPEKAVPVMVASRIQRWAEQMAAHRYEIVYRESAKHANADVLSRLPLGPDPEFDKQESTSSIAVCQIRKESFETLPVTAKKVKGLSQKDPVLSKVLQFVRNGWPSDMKLGNLQPFHQRRDELSIQNGCLMWGLRVVVPVKLRSSLLNELHSSHAGMVRMKSLAMMHFWWPNIDAEIETMTRSCIPCQMSAKNPKKAPLHPWEFPRRPWQRIHLDFAGPFQQRMWLVGVDAHSKWPTVIPVNSTTTDATITILRHLFALHGLPKQLVTDNGPQFTSVEFREFCQIHGIQHILTPPYHPASNGEAERLVQSFKGAMIKAVKGGGDKDLALAKFLLQYRVTPHPTTGRPPCELLMGRHLRTKLDLLRPELVTDVERCQNRDVVRKNGKNCRTFHVGEQVKVRNYTGSEKWVLGTVTKILSPVSYRVKVTNDLNWKRHVEQMLPYYTDSFTDVPVQAKQRSSPLRVQNESHELDDPVPAAPRRNPPRQVRGKTTFRMRALQGDV